MVLARLSFDLWRPVTRERITPSVTVLRDGRKARTVESSLAQGGKPVARCTAVFLKADAAHLRRREPERVELHQSGPDRRAVARPARAMDPAQRRNTRGRSGHRRRTRHAVGPRRTLRRVRANVVVRKTPSPTTRSAAVGRASGFRDPPNAVTRRRRGDYRSSSTIRRKASAARSFLFLPCSSAQPVMNGVGSHGPSWLLCSRSAAILTSRTSAMST